MHEQMKARRSSHEVRACVSCDGTVTGSRCEACGTPVAPGGFRVLSQLAQGPHSRMFLAERDGQRVALKELLFALVPDAAQLDAFEREVTFLRQLSHPRIPRLVDSFREGSGVHTRLYLAQEFVQGPSLLQELAHHRFSEAEVREVARSLLELLIYLHGLSPQVIHRDLKPANVMRRADGELVLVDFGSARELLRGATHRSTLVGTFGYMPPEQLGGTVDATSDLYALGATLIHLLSRRPPEELYREGMELVFEDAVNASPGMKAFLARLVERERSRRFPSARAALEALESLTHRKQERAPEAPRRRPGFLALASTGVGVALLVAGGCYLQFRSGSASPPPAPKASRVVPPAPSMPPAPARAPSRRQAASPEREVAELITLPEPERAHSFLLTKDVRLSPGQEVPLGGAEQCGPQPSRVELRELRLRAEGGGTLEAPRSELFVDVTLRNHGATQRGCHRAVLRLLDDSGQPLAPEVGFVNDRTGTERSRELRFSFPRTRREVLLQVGTADEPGTTFVLELVGGTLRPR